MLITPLIHPPPRPSAGLPLTIDCLRRADAAAWKALAEMERGKFGAGAITAPTETAR